MIGVFDAGWSTNYYWNSNGATVTVTATPTAPAAPTGLRASAGNAQVALSWTASSGATSYKVFRGASAGGEAGSPVATGVIATTYTDTGLTNETTYFYKVAAVNTGGTSAMSSEASAKPTAVPSACDVNHNTFTDASDVQVLISQILGTQAAASDLNHDGAVNVVDAQIVMNAVLSLSCSGS